MNFEYYKNKFEEIKTLKEKNNFENYDIYRLLKLPSFDGVCELNFENKNFKMLNIGNDDAVALKYFWKNKYENFSHKLWYNKTRGENYFFDVGAHTGIYSTIAHLGKVQNTVISFEPFYLNYSRPLSNFTPALSTACCLFSTVNTPFKIGIPVSIDRVLIALVTVVDKKS